MEFLKILYDYFNFTRKEKIGIIVIIGLIVITWFLPGLIFRFSGNKKPLGDTSWIVQLKKLIRTDSFGEIKNDEQSDPGILYAKKKDSNSRDEDEYDFSFHKPSNEYFSRQKNELFYFDPNTLSPEGWQKLGLRNKTIRTILNYLNKGGHFNKPGDLERIYGLHHDEYERLYPFIRIVQIETKKSEVYNSKSDEFIKSKSINVNRYSVIDINTADTSDFISLPGIGSKLAARIVRFRDKLGGFYSIDQVKETYALPDSTFQKIRQYLKLENTSVKKININIATKDELKMHPYIKWNLANAIVEYRNQHGDFISIHDLKNIRTIDEAIFLKIAFYLTIN